MNLDTSTHEEYFYNFDTWSAATLGNLAWFLRIPTSDLKLRINQKNKGGWTPLMYASYYGHQPIVEFLLKNGANVSCLSKSHKTALIMSAMGGNESCSTALLKHDANVNDQDSGGWTALMHAASYGYSSVVQILITHGADVNQQCGGENITALMVACEAGQLDVVQILLDAGANTQLLSASKQSAYSLACDGGHKNVAAILEGDQCQSSRIHFGPRKIQELISSPKGGHPSSPLIRVAFTTDLKAILGNVGLAEYFPLFKQKDVDFFKFLKLTADDLKALGVLKIGPRSKLANLIKKMNSQQSASSPVENHMNYQVPRDIVKEKSETLDPSQNHDGAVSSCDIPCHFLSNLSSLQHKLEHLLYLTGSLKKSSSREDFPHSQLATMATETDDLAKDIYGEFKTIFGAINESN